MKVKSQVTEWRPPVGTKVKIVRHSAWGGFFGIVVEHQKWMGKKTMAVEIDGVGTRAGVTEPDQFEVVDMSQVEFGSPEAQVILDLDKQAEKNAERIVELTAEIREQMNEIEESTDEINGLQQELSHKKRNLQTLKSDLAGLWNKPIPEKD